MRSVRVRESVQEQDLLPHRIKRESRPCRKTIGSFRKRAGDPFRTEVAVGPDRELTIALVDRRVEEAELSHRRQRVRVESLEHRPDHTDRGLPRAVQEAVHGRHIPTSVDRKTSKQIRGLAAPPHPPWGISCRRFGDQRHRVRSGNRPAVVAARETDPDTGRKGNPDGVGAGERDHSTTRGTFVQPVFARPAKPNSFPATFRIWISSVPSVMR